MLSEKKFEIFQKNYLTLRAFYDILIKPLGTGHVPKAYEVCFACAVRQHEKNFKKVVDKLTKL